MSRDGSDNSPLSVYSVEWTVKYSSKDTPSQKKCLWHGFNFVISALQYIILLREKYKFKVQNIIVTTVSTNTRPLCDTYFYVNWRTKFKFINMFFGMVTQFQNNSKRANYVTTFILTSRWKYCTRNDQMAHAIPQDKAINKTNFEYKWYDLCGLLCADNYSSKSHLVMPVKYPIHIGIKLHSLFHESIWRKKICTWCLVNKEYAIIGQFYT